ncbi:MULTISPECIES: type IV secretion system protein VirB10 [unclassified Acinetobacter]|uniref:type IV secretion system protein VirB10 n=1 Tax=unclassified Acinetobacter TaxID=196816 RepID=UPI0015D10635|nr:MULTISPECIES: type IV secretion system protein VirB10 [unclassified Acinetobacter]
MNKNPKNQDDDLDDDLSIVDSEKDIDLSRFEKTKYSSNDSNMNNVGVESVADYDGRSVVGNRKKFGQGMSMVMVFISLLAVGMVAWGVWYATNMSLDVKGEDQAEQIEDDSSAQPTQVGSRNFGEEFQQKQLTEQQIAEQDALIADYANNGMNQEITPIGEDAGMYAPAPMPTQPMPDQQMAYAPAPMPMEKPKSASELRLERMLGSEFNNNVGGAVAGSIRPISSGQEENEQINTGNGGGLSRLDNVKGFASAKAGKMGNRDLTLDKGAFIDCVMTTKFHSQLAGMMTCEVTRNIYSASGRVILIDRGSRVTGQYQGDVKTGQSRVFVVWDRIVTPKGVSINIDSPASSELGESGLTGRVNNHFFKRFGGALLVSLVTGVSDGVGKSVGASIGREIDKGLGNDGNDTTVIDLGGGGSNSAGDVAGKIIEQTSNIPPSIVKHQGDKVTIFVARDVDFSSVYGLNYK